MAHRNDPASRARAQLNVPIQPAMARPISSGESSWTKWTPATFTSYCAGHLRTKSTIARLARIPPGSAFTNSLGTPRQRRPSPLAGLGERPSVLRHLLDGEGAQDGLRQDLVDEEVVLQDHRFAGLGTQRLQGWTHIRVVPVVPALRPHDRLHVRDTLQGLAVAVGPVEAEGRAPVMDDEGDPLVHIQGLEQGVEVAAVLDAAIRAGGTVRQLIGVAHADQVGGDASAHVSFLP